MSPEQTTAETVTPASERRPKDYVRPSLHWAATITSFGACAYVLGTIVEKLWLLSFHWMQLDRCKSSNTSPRPEI